MIKHITRKTGDGFDVKNHKQKVVKIIINVITTRIAFTKISLYHLQQ